MRIQTNTVDTSELAACVHALRVLHNEAWAEYLAPIRRQVDHASLSHFRELFQFRMYHNVSSIPPLDDSEVLFGRDLLGS